MTAPLTPESRRWNPTTKEWDSQTDALIDACHSKGVYSPVDLEAHDAAAIARYAEGLAYRADECCSGCEEPSGHRAIPEAQGSASPRAAR